MNARRGRADKIYQQNSGRKKGVLANQSDITGPRKCKHQASGRIVVKKLVDWS